MYCRECGQMLKEGARFCARCGVAVGGARPVAAAEQRPRQRPAQPVRQSVQERPAQPVQESPAQAAPQPAQSSGRRRFVLTIVLGLAAGVALVAAVFAIVSTLRGQTTVAVTIPLEVPGLDAEGTRVPVEATGTDEDGNEVEVRAYLAADGSCLSLPLGTYEVHVLGSPISAKGVLYEVPKGTVEVTLDEEAVEAGQTQATSDALTFTRIAHADATDEQIDEALEWATADEGLEQGKAQELADAAREARDEAVQKAQEQAEEQAEKAAEAAEQAEREANTLHVGNVAFLVPEDWREGMDIERSATGITINTSSGTYVFSLSTGAASYYVTNSSPYKTIDLESGWQLGIHRGEDGAVPGEITDAQGNRICELTTMRFDGNEFGGGSGIDSAGGRAAQAAITDLDSDADPGDLLVECLRVCAENVTMSADEAPSKAADSDQGASKDDAASAEAEHAQLRADAESRGMQVFEGTVRVASLYDLALERGGDSLASNFSSSGSETVVVVVFDGPRTVEGKSGDGMGTRSADIDRIEATNGLELGMTDGDRVCVAANASDLWYSSSVRYDVVPASGTVALLYVE